MHNLLYLYHYPFLLGLNSTQSMMFSTTNIAVHMMRAASLHPWHVRGGKALPDCKGVIWTVFYLVIHSFLSQRESQAREYQWQPTDETEEDILLNFRRRSVLITSDLWWTQPRGEMVFCGTYGLRHVGSKYSLRDQSLIIMSALWFTTCSSEVNLLHSRPLNYWTNHRKKCCNMFVCSWQLIVFLWPPVW